MDDSKKRQIPEEIYDKVTKELGEGFLDDMKQEDLTKIVQRRTDPVISDNINTELRKAMLDHRLSDEDYLKTFLQIKKHVFYNKTPVEKPTATVTISQTGAGKSNLTKEILKKQPNTVVINPDEYKKFRPDVKQILEENPTYFGALTGIDSYDHADNVSNYATNRGYNVIFECAPSLKQGLVGVNVGKLRDAGYQLQFSFLAVGDLISSLAIHKRYEMDLQLGGKPGEVKLTDLARHDESYEEVKKTLKNLKLDDVSIYRRGTKEENYLPVKISNVSMNNKEKVTVFEDERKKSNDEYCMDGFKDDYESIKRMMDGRNAPSKQKEQLELVHHKFINYLEENNKENIKNKENNDREI